MALPSLSFTPPIDCDVVITATFECQKTAGGGSDWGGGTSGYYYLRWLDDGNSSNYGDSPSYPVTSSRARYAVQWKFTGTAGLATTVYLRGGAGLGYQLTFWNMELQVELIKR